MRSLDDYIIRTFEDDSITSGDQPLHIVCKQGDIENICDYLDQHDILGLHLKNRSGLTPILCISDPELRVRILRKYHYVCEAISMQAIDVLRQLLVEATDKYKSLKSSSLFRFGLFRAEELLTTMDGMMDPFGQDSNIAVLDDMINAFIKHLDRIEGYYGFRHRGNLYTTSQDPILIQMIYTNRVTKRIFNLSEIDFQRVDYAYRCELRENLIRAFYDFKSVLWDHLLPEILEDFIILNH